jgi:hypothetical protein
MMSAFDLQKVAVMNEYDSEKTSTESLFGDFFHENSLHLKMNNDNDVKEGTFDLSTIIWESNPF